MPKPFGEPKTLSVAQLPLSLKSKACLKGLQSRVDTSVSGGVGRVDLVLGTGGDGGF